MTVSHGKEYFPSSIYGPASRRVVADGQPVPRGGGQYLVGKPYTIAGRTYYPSESRKAQVGYASWYGDAFHGRLTANGEIYDRDAFTAASPTMPLPSYARVTNLRNHYSMIVRVNDRGPYASDRIMDVSRRVAEALDYKRYGTTMLKVEYVGRASLAGSDDARLYATLRRDAPTDGQGRGTMVARAPVHVQVASNSRYKMRPADRDEKRNAETDEVESARSPAAETLERGGGSSIKQRRIAMADQRADWRDETPMRDADEEARAPRPRHVENRAERVRRDEARYTPVGYTPVGEARRPAKMQAEDQLMAKGLARSARGIKPATLYREAVMPPSRPMDLGTIPGAAIQIHAHRDPPKLRVARSRDD